MACDNRQVSLLAIALALTALVACGDDADAHQPDAQAGTGGTGGAGGNGTDAGGTGGSGIDAGGTGASDAAIGRDASIEDVDLTLGGFNQDLPAPSMDCLTREGLILGCVAISVEYNGEAFEYYCEEDSVLVGYGGGHVFGCGPPRPLAGKFSVEMLVSRAVLAMPSVTFTADMPTPAMFATVWNAARMFQGYNNRDFSMNLLADTHDESFRAAGISEAVPFDWRVDGTFALSLIPKSTCVPDSMGFGCDEVRLRGNFRVFPQERYK